MHDNLMKYKSLAKSKEMNQNETIVSENLAEMNSKMSASGDESLPQNSIRTDINDKIINLERALEINEESK